MTYNPNNDSGYYDINTVDGLIDTIAYYIVDHLMYRGAYGTDEDRESLLKIIDKKSLTVPELEDLIGGQFNFAAIAENVIYRLDGFSKSSPDMFEAEREHYKEIEKYVKMTDKEITEQLKKMFLDNDG